MQNHAAKDHKGSTCLSTSSSIPSNLVPDDDPIPCTIIQSNSPISDEAIRPHQSETLNLPSTPITNTGPPLQDNLQLQSSDLIAQKDASHQSPTVHQRFFLDLFAGHSAALTVAAKGANLHDFSPFDIEFNHMCNILDDIQFENLLQVVHSGLIGAIWSAPPCK